MEKVVLDVSYTCKYRFQKKKKINTVTNEALEVNRI